MENILFNVWAPVLVSSIISATIAIVVYKIEKLKERKFELYKTSLRRICLLLDKEITKENLVKILEIKDEMPKKYLNKKTKKNLSTLISKYESLLTNQVYFENQAKLFVESLYNLLKEKNLQLDGFMEKDAYWCDCLNQVEKYFEQHPFLFAEKEIVAISNAISLCSNLYPLFNINQNSEFTSKCYTEYIRIQRKDSCSFDEMLENVQLKKYIHTVRNLFEDFKRECECYY